ncbi:MAG TPA: hydrogenase expression/formation protein HypE [Gammaproteobacteria bacterium]|nr:hydrogenase expression/formation protein HypE [Gammaproteobacteria bacterium]HRP86358.1 hydrogenase expression/formation protein HypE [Gammaproteobacteria bacterium]
MALDEARIGLAHGNGGRFMRELIQEVFARHLGGGILDTDLDACPLPRMPEGELVFTTDGFTVQPLEFPGGNIGSLAVHGTTNDLAVAGATPLYLSLNVFIEEGLEVELLDRIVASLAAAAREAGVEVAAGDTKVLRRGEGGGLYLATTGIGVRPHGLRLSMKEIRPGDQLLVSGSVGDHGICVMLAREQFGLSGDLLSDAASVLPLTRALLGFEGLRFMRDPTRGGLATVAHEIARATGCSVRLSEAAIPVRDQVRSVCEMLGYDPYYLACEGRVVAVLAPEDAERALAAWRGLPGGEHAAVIGQVEAEGRPVVIETELGGRRMLEELEDDPLPRIC